MISLSLLLNEAGLGVAEQAWKTPSGTPDEVIDIMHNVIAQIQAAGENPKTTITFDKVAERFWVITHLKKGFSIGFDEKRKDWSFSWKGQQPVEINDVQLNQIINSWMK